MGRFSDIQVDEIVQICLDIYNKFSKTGKPIENEWTVLSCVLQYDCANGIHEVVSLGTGSKCVGANKMSAAGVVLNDSHAEVFARRGFLLYLYDQLTNETSSIFIKENGKFKLRENTEFIFYSSQLPCGDASIIPKTDEEEHFGDVIQLKRSLIDDICETQCKKVKLDADIHRTGAKCLPDSEQDTKQAGMKYHLIGQVRTKPGRGDRTLSVSCSDKMARWAHVGIQGGLLDMLLHEPIFIKHFIFGAGVPYSEESLKRALLERNQKSSILESNIPEFYQSVLSFPHIRTENNVRPAPASIVWGKMNNQILEVAVQGKKLGLTKKKAMSPGSSLSISKYKIYEKFQDILIKNNEIKHRICIESVQNIPYNEMKRKSKRYLDNWMNVKETVFKTWTVKPDIWSFCTDIKI